MFFSRRASRRFVFFFFNDTATTEIYTLSLHDALPILAAPIFAQNAQPASAGAQQAPSQGVELTEVIVTARRVEERLQEDRKSTRLNSSHSQISYAVFCLKKKKTN